MAAVMSVLLVDDNGEFLDSIARLLAEDSRMRIVGRASSGQEALEMTARLKPDVVFMDLAMPEMNGLQATRQLKEQSTPPHVVIMTCHGNKEYQVAASIAGADAFISKDDFYAHFPRLLDWLLRQRNPRGDSSKEP
jgi:DNA-binding NarL/FixJ family response regulator